VRSDEGFEQEEINLRARNTRRSRNTTAKAQRGLRLQPAQRRGRLSIHPDRLSAAECRREEIYNIAILSVFAIFNVHIEIL